MQVKYKTGICSCHGKERLIVNKSKNLCFAGSAAASRERTKQRKIKAGTYEDPYKLPKFYADFYVRHPTKTCFETGVPIHSYRSWNCHHVLEKKEFPEYKFNADVCVLLTLEQHSLWHTLAPSDREIKMPKTHTRFLELKQKYNV